MNEIDQLLVELDHAHAGDPWHGPSRAAVLADVTAVEAARRPPGGAHSIWELVLHMAGWTSEVARRLRGGAPQLPPEGDWPAVPATPTEAEWSAAKHRLDAAHQDLASALATFPAERLSELVKANRDAPLGAGKSYGATLRGVLQHDAYHTGQIAILKRVLRGGEARVNT
jgi:uncharacterized damage-inducible protein DinB